MPLQPPFAILWPVFALAAWTGCVLLLVAAKRVGAGMSGRVHPREYALGESPNVPAEICLPNRNYMNLLELPVLFYVACLLAFVTNTGARHLVLLAWLYVALRVVHSLIHVTYNHVMHRFAAFAASNFVLAAMWVAIALAIASAA